MTVLRLKKDLRRSIRRGHPWLFDRALRSGPELAPGEVVQIAAPGGARVATGFVDPKSPIRVRILGEAGIAVDAGWVRRRAARAATLRSRNPSLADCTGMRAIHGEGDGMPGLVVDLYDGSGVVQFDGAAARALWSRPRLLEAVVAGFADGGLTCDRLWSREAGALHGDPPPAEILFREGRARFLVDTRRGHKTGWFLDQRPNRRWLGSVATGASVLDLFCYAGGFAVHAALGGARKVTLVDAAGPALDAARANLERNDADLDRCEFRRGDAFEVLAAAGRRGEKFSIVVCDPPSFVPNEKARARGIAAYRRINRAALALLEPGGLLLSASCSSHVSEAELATLVAEVGAAEGRRGRLIRRGGAGGDHPTLPAFPEGRYLSCLAFAFD